MNLSLPALAAALAVSFAATTPARATNQYALDDGIPNSGLTYGIAADYCWFQSFATVGTVDSIHQVQIYWQPGSVPPGTIVRLCVWEDPNDDGDPADAALVAQSLGFVPNLTAAGYVTYPLPTPGIVHDRFFVGAVVTTDGSFGTIANLDYDSGLSGRAWFATDAPNTFDPTLLSMSSYNHIEVIGAGIHGVYLLRATGSGDVPVTYCTAKANSAGCVPQIASFGVPSVSAGAGFHVYATGVLNRAPGLLIYGSTGRAALPFGGGTLCLASPIRRTPVQTSGGHATGVDCTGTYHVDFSAWIPLSADPLLSAGATVNAQFYSRDNGFLSPDNIGLTNALEFTLVP